MMTTADLLCILWPTDVNTIGGEGSSSEEVWTGLQIWPPDFTSRGSSSEQVWTGLQWWPPDVTSRGSHVWRGSGMGPGEVPYLEGGRSRGSLYSEVQCIKGIKHLLHFILLCSVPLNMIGVWHLYAFPTMWSCLILWRNNFIRCWFVQFSSWLREGFCPKFLEFSLTPTIFRYPMRTLIRTWYPELTPNGLFLCQWMAISHWKKIIEIAKMAFQRICVATP